MNLKDLCDKHAQQWAEFQIAREAAWGKIQDDHNNVKAAFGNDASQLPESAQKTYDEAKKDWGKEWGDQGRVSKMIKELQKEEMSAHLSRVYDRNKGKDREPEQTK